LTTDEALISFFYISNCLTSDPWKHQHITPYSSFNTVYNDGNMAADPKPGLSGPPPGSEVPTLAPSKASVSDDGKASAAGEQTDVEVGSVGPIKASSDNEKEEQDESDEKQDPVDALAKQATATSKTSKKLERTVTREDGTEYPTGLKLGLIVLALCLGVFTMALGMFAVELE
jgi:hypothetical protein